MEMKPFFPEVKQDAGPERNEHDRDAKFEPAAQPIRYIDFEENDEASGQGKRERVTDSPEHANPAASEKASFPAHERRDSHNVIGVRGVFQAKEEAQTQDCNKRRFHQGLSEYRLFRRQHLVFGRAEISADTVLLDLVDDDFIPKLFGANEELDRFVDQFVLLFELAVVDLNDDAVLLLLGIRLAQLQADVPNAHHFVFLRPS